MQLLDVARYAPNGANRQIIRWLVINDPAKVHRLAEMTIDWMKVVKEKNPALLCGSQAGIVCRGAMGVRPGSHFPGRRRAFVMACAPKDQRAGPSGGHDCHSPNSTGGAGAFSFTA